LNVFSIPSLARLPTAPIDDEPLSPQDEVAIAEASEWAKHNKATPHEDFLAELGITQEEIDNYRQSK
jgi:hypothetical protein